MRQPKFNARSYTPREVCDLSVADINRAFRAVDESHLFPINGRFNVTERAIRRIRVVLSRFGANTGGYEYCLMLENEISNIVNDPRI